VLLREEDRLRRGDGEWLSGLSGVSERTLRSWRGQDGSVVGPGRPGHSVADERAALWAVARQWRVEGPTAGWRPLDDKLPQTPTRLVQAGLSRLKRRSRRRQERRRRAQRVHVEVLHRDVLWSQDGTHLGRCRRRPVNAEVVREVASGRTLDASVRDRAPRDADIRAQLQTLADQGRLPLVWATDNGSWYRSGAMRAWLAAQGVLDLPNRPHTAQDNPWAERGHRELKAEAGLGRGVVLDSVEEAVVRLAVARERLDEYRLRPRLGARTAAAVDSTLPSWEGLVDRRAFYAAACRAREDAVLGLTDARARRTAERQAIWRTLESFGLVRRTRGGAPLPPQQAEGIS